MQEKIITLLHFWLFYIMPIIVKCPFCSNTDTQVKDSRPSDDDSAIRRRRLCGHCGARFTTFERVQLRELTIIKKDNLRELFDREKILRSLHIALRKRDVPANRVEDIVNSITRRLESIGENEIPSKTIGEMVMEALHNLDIVAFVRYASVYRDFSQIKDFENIIANVSDDE